MGLLQRINVGISVAVLAISCLAMLSFGWSATGWKALAIPTKSMQPLIPRGSLVLVHRVPVSSFRIGDVITHINPLKPTQTLSHRIIKINTLNGHVQNIITKGDANNVPDLAVTPSMVVGKVVKHIPWIGFIMLEGKKPIVTLPIVYLATLLVIFEEVLKLNDYFKKILPYKLFGYKQNKVSLNKKSARPNILLGLSVLSSFLIIAGIVAPQADAFIFKSNAVSLTGNRIAYINPNSHQKHQCTGTTNNNTTVNVNNSNTQSASSGNASVTGNTSGGNASSGSASNTNTSSTTVVITNC